MDIEEVLKKATARPWGVEPEDMDDHYKPAMVFGAFDTDEPKVICDLAARHNNAENSELIVLAVNAFEADRELIRQLTVALERVYGNFDRLLAGQPVRDASETIAEADAALAAAKERRPC